MINVHNGDVMAVHGRRAGLPGEHFAFRESLILGPVTSGPDSLAMRARFLAEAFREEPLRMSNNLFEQEQAIHALESQDEIVLWFEHDLFCLVHFIYLLQRLRRRNVSYIWTPEPLAMKEADDLLLLYNSRAPVTPALFETATRAWAAYSSPDPRLLNEVIAAPGNELPFLGEGLKLHASRFPSVRNGLGAAENRLLTLIGAGITDFARLFPLFDDRVPKYGFGDSQVLYILRYLASRVVPVITMEELRDAAFKATFAVTPAGQNVMSGAVDDTIVNEPDFYLGGAHVRKETLWRWDESSSEIILSPSAVS